MCSRHHSTRVRTSHDVPQDLGVQLGAASLEVFDRARWQAALGRVHDVLANALLRDLKDLRGAHRGELVQPLRERQGARLAERRTAGQQARAARRASPRTFW
eukprot:scaffold735_cov376-Prasinococcus_capsulatus_cf.AAC.13